MRSKNKYPLEWETHEEHVAAIYKLLGYRVTHNINVDGQQADLICEKIMPGAGRTTLYVECKHTKEGEQSSVSKDVVNTFINNFRALQSKHRWATGVMVSNKPFSQYALAAASSHPDIVLKTIDDLYADVFQIQSYLHSSIELYESEGIFHDYIPQKARKLLDTSEVAAPTQDLSSIFNSWLVAHDSSQLCLLGDFGTGKTTFMRHVHYTCAKDFLSGKSTRMPLLITLRNYYDVGAGPEIIERFFSVELAAKVPYHIFDKFMRAGRFLLLLDGFDEMGLVSDSDIRHRNYLKLCQLITLNSKVAITCRPSYFLTQEEMINVFGFYQRQMGLESHVIRGRTEQTKAFTELSARLRKASEGKGSENLLNAMEHSADNNLLVVLQLFDDSQIKSYLAAHKNRIKTDSEGQLNNESLFVRIREIYDLEDLARRPILLKLIVNTLPLFKRGTDDKYRIVINGRTLVFDDITPSVLYYVYTEQELTREYKKGEVRWQIDRRQRREVIGQLAYHMFQNNSLVIDEDSLSSIVSAYFHKQGEHLAQLTTDIRTCSFLVFDNSSSLRFAHKSFLEYFVAQHLINHLNTAAKTKKNLSSQILSEEILYFLGDLINAFFPAYIQILNEINISPLNDICTCNALNLLNYARHPLTYLEKVNIQRLSYIKQDMRTLELSECKIEILRFMKSRFNDLLMKNVSCESAIFDNVVSSKLTINASRFETMNLTNAQVDRVSITESSTQTMLLNNRTKAQRHDVIQSLEFDSFSTECAEYSDAIFKLQAINSHLKNFKMTRCKLEGGVIADSTFVADVSENTVLKNLRFRNVLFLNSNHKHIKYCQMQKVIFDNCIFLYVDCNDFLGKAEFINCIFIRCNLDSRDELTHVEGSGGFFQRSNSHRQDIEKKQGFPCLWTIARAERGTDRFFNAAVRNNEEKNIKTRIKTLEDLTWEDVLSVAFPRLQHGLESLTLKDVRAKLEQTQKDLGIIARLPPSLITPSSRANK